MGSMVDAGMFTWSFHRSLFDFALVFASHCFYRYVYKRNVPTNNEEKRNPTGWSDNLNMHLIVFFHTNFM